MANISTNLSTKLGFARVPDITTENINSYTTSGVYQAWFSPNLPTGISGAWGILIVIHGTSVVCEQIMITVNGIAVRHYESGVWGNWRKGAFSAVT